MNYYLHGTTEYFYYKNYKSFKPRNVTFLYPVKTSEKQEFLAGNKEMKQRLEIG